MYDVIKFICFTHNLLHSIPQIAEMKQEIGLQEKRNSHNSFKVRPTNGNNTYDELQDNRILVISLLHLLFKV